MSESQMSDADEVGARVAREDIAGEPRVVNERTVSFRPPSLVGRLPQKDYDACIVGAAVRLNDVLDGLEIDAPGEVGEALTQLRNAVVNARRA